MTRNDTARAFGQPTLQDLTVQFLASRSDAATAAVEYAAEGEVELHEIAVGFRVDPRSAWADAVAACPVSPDAATAPADWAGLVAQPTAVAAQPFALGHFPQRVKDLQALLTRFHPSDSRPRTTVASAPGLSGLRAHVVQLAAKGRPEAQLQAVGLSRALGDLQASETHLAGAESRCVGELRAVWENERASLLWQRGEFEAALAAWEAMPETSASLFNRGMALLFLGRSKEARPFLAHAAEAIPETSGWNALARLYLALSSIYG